MHGKNVRISCWSEISCFRIFRRYYPKSYVLILWCRGHLEVVQILYDPDQVDYENLLDTFWKQIDPIDSGGQFADRVREYSSAIYYYNDEQKLLAEESKKIFQNMVFFQSLSLLLY